MKDYMLIFRESRSRTASMPHEQLQAETKNWNNWVNKVSRNHQILKCEPLQQEGKQLIGTKKKVSNGPFVEGKEYIDGYALIKGNDYDDIVALSRDCPVLEHDDGIVEIREIMDMSTSTSSSSSYSSSSASSPR